MGAMMDNDGFTKVYNTTLEKGAFPSQLTYLTTTERIIFIIVFSVLFLVSLAGNIAAIFVTIRRNHRFIQKTSIISLALSDLCMSIAYSTNNLETFSHPMINWVLGEFACSFIPMAQIFGLIVNLCSMVVIALDRYQNVVKVLAHRWNPQPLTCILGFFIIWFLCLGVSYPIFPMFEVKLLKVYYAYPASIYEIYSFCVTPVKDQLRTYYICIASLIFATLWSCFLWLNCSIARLIWSHRKPVNSNSNKYENSVSRETSTTQMPESLGNIDYVSPNGNCNRNHMNDSNKYILHKRNLHVERKIRTFKIIVFSMFVFTLCRLPFWIFNVLKLSSDLYNERRHWVMTYWFNALALLNCAVNPFLYSFLHPTLNVICKLWRLVIDVARKICRWYCTATEFDEFGKENPFSAEIKRVNRPTKTAKRKKGDRQKMGKVITGTNREILDYPVGRSYHLQRY